MLYTKSVGHERDFRPNRTNGSLGECHSYRLSSRSLGHYFFQSKRLGRMATPWCHRLALILVTSDLSHIRVIRLMRLSKSYNSFVYQNHPTLCIQNVYRVF